MLRGAGHGAAIDRHDAVVRTNLAPVEGYEADVGSRTTFDLINLHGLGAASMSTHTSGLDLSHPTVHKTVTWRTLHKTVTWRT